MTKRMGANPYLEGALMFSSVRVWGLQELIRATTIADLPYSAIYEACPKKLDCR